MNHHALSLHFWTSIIITCSLAAREISETNLPEARSFAQTAKPIAPTSETITKDDDSSESVTPLPTGKEAGIIFGAIIGSILGRTTEFVFSEAELRAKFGRQGLTGLKQLFKTHTPTDTTVTDHRGNPYNPQASPTYMFPLPDDALFAEIVLEQSLRLFPELVTSKLSPEEFSQSLAERFVTTLVTESHRLTRLRAQGRSTQNTIEKLAQQKRLNVASWWTPDAKKISLQEKSDGAVARAWPIGLVFANHTPLIVPLSTAQAITTHRHPTALAASAALAIGIQKAYQGHTPDEISDAMIATARQFHDDELAIEADLTNAPRPHTIRDYQRLIQTNQITTAQLLEYATLAAKNKMKPRAVFGTLNNPRNANRSATGLLLGWNADEAVAGALYLFLRNANEPDGFWKGIIEGVNNVGNSDAIAALTGALLGAHKGLQVPEDEKPFIPHIENYTEWHRLAEIIKKNRESAQSQQASA